jgi:hypothetical protein
MVMPCTWGLLAAAKATAGQNTQGEACKATDEPSGQASAGAVMQGSREKATQVSSDAASGSGMGADAATPEERTGEAADPAGLGPILDLGTCLMHPPRFGLRRPTVTRSTLLLRPLLRTL